MTFAGHFCENLEISRSRMVNMMLIATEVANGK